MDERIFRGEIPWTGEGLLLAFEDAAKLHNTPHDDWDRTPRFVDVVSDDGVDRVIFNPDKLLNQIMQRTATRLRKEGLADDVIRSHLFRFLEVRAFLAEHRDVLQRADLIVLDSAEFCSVSTSLLEVLATAKYEGVKLEGPELEPVPTFHLDRVIVEAKERM